jgi:hypothetical protein
MAPTGTFLLLTQESLCENGEPFAQGYIDQWPGKMEDPDSCRQSEVRMKTRVQALTAALALCCVGVSGETTAKPSITLVQAELMTDVQAHRMKVGATVFARTTDDWQGPECVLRTGAILEAHVVSVVPHTRAARDSELSLAFTRAQCGEKKMSDFKMTPKAAPTARTSL